MLFIVVPLLWLATGTKAAPIPLEMVDMSYVFDETTLHWPTQKEFEMTVKFNETTAEGYWLQLEEYNSAIHVGTHMDAPCHFAKGRWTVDEIPLHRLVGPAAVIDITQKAEENRDAFVEVQDLENWEKLSGHRLDNHIVMIRSGWGRRWPDREAFTGTPNKDADNLHFPGFSPEAAQWLVDNRRIYGVGTETLSLDYGPSKDFLAHRILLGANIYGLENVANVEKLPLFGATLYAMPMKIGKGSGAPTRIFATFPKIHI
ncbi:Kynurenine formamidase, partial [Stegodyphus mimosarum]